VEQLLRDFNLMQHRFYDVPLDLSLYVSQRLHDALVEQKVTGIRLEPVPGLS
jgi:hypothetical protein